jgi:DNA-binding beta-propeller fold protein YncE
VADTLDHRVERLGPDGAYLGQTGYISANSGYASPNTGNGQFNTPGGIAVDRGAGRVWVADTANSRVQALGLDGTWQATATAGRAPGSSSRRTGSRSTPARARWSWPTRATTACSASP